VLAAFRPTLLGILAALFFCAGASAATHPNFTGTWKLLDSEHYIIDQNAERLRIIMIVQDGLGQRVLDVQSPIDGQPHQQTVGGFPCTMTARWSGDTLTWETRRDSPDGIVHNRRAMTLAPDGATITARRTRLWPAPEFTGNETWRRQDPLLQPTTCFQDRDVAFASDATPLARGIVAARFQQREMAERELLPILREAPRSADAATARSVLADVYSRAGMIALTQAQEPSGFRKALARHPELTVARRAPSTLKFVREPDGRVDVPVTASGKPAVYRIDTGSSMSLLSRSEAARLGLKVERLAMELEDLGGGRSSVRLAILPVLVIGQTELHQVPFWVADDKRFGIRGILGIDILLALQTLRWRSDGSFETGFASEPADLRRANLCFDGATPVAQASYAGDGLAFVVDTGNTDSGLFPSFATQFPSAVAQAKALAEVEVAGYVGHSRLRNVLVPEIPLRFGEWETALRPAAVSLDRVPLWSAWHYGCAGIDLLNRARSVTFDFKAMRLTLER
jgi:predicted aspartyl protease